MKRDRSWDMDLWCRNHEFYSISGFQDDAGSHC